MQNGMIMGAEQSFIPRLEGHMQCRSLTRLLLVFAVIATAIQSPGCRKSNEAEEKGKPPARAADDAVLRRLVERCRDGSARFWAANSVKIHLARPDFVRVPPGDSAGARLLEFWGENQNDYSVPMMRVDKGEKLFEVPGEDFARLRAGAVAQESPAAATAPAVPTAKSALEAFAMEAQLLESPASCRTPAIPTDVADLLKKHADANSTDHLPYLVEYGLRIHWKLLQQTGMARELPVQENLAISELVRLAGIAKYRTAHEAGWLDRQFYGPFADEGWSSYQVYVWVKEHDSLVADLPNAARIAETLKMIDTSARNGLGGDGRCHYGCQ